MSLFTREPELQKHSIEPGKDSIDLDFNQSYNQLAAKLGVCSRAVVTACTLRGVLAEQSIGVYDLERVEAYMDNKGYWAWYPLRATDLRHRIQIKRVKPTEWPTLYGSPEGELYNNPVPYPVLLTVNSILERCSGSKRRFHSVICYWALQPAASPTEGKGPGIAKVRSGNT